MDEQSDGLTTGQPPGPEQLMVEGLWLGLLIMLLLLLPLQLLLLLLLHTAALVPPGSARTAGGRARAVAHP